MGTAKTMRAIDKNSLPENHLLVSVGEGSIFHYAACGIDSVYVKGALVEHPTYAGWYRIDRIEEIHHQIGTHVLSESEATPGIVNPSHFRFMRRDMGLTLADVCTELGADFQRAEAWENGAGIAPTGAEKIVSLFQEYRKAGYSAFLAARHHSKVAA